MEQFELEQRSSSGRPEMPAVAELVHRVATVERALDDLYALDGAAARQLLDELRAIRRVVRHVDDLVWLLAHDQAGLSWRELGAHLDRFHNATRARYLRAKQRHPGGFDDAARAAVRHDQEDRKDTGD